jgi:sulfite reductase (ferredoxin)
LLVAPKVSIDDKAAFDAWKIKCNSKKAGYVAIGIKVVLGDFYTDNARLLADLIKNYGANCVFAKTKHCTTSYKGRKFRVFLSRISKLGFVELGYDTTLDITAVQERTLVTLVLPAVQVSLLNGKSFKKQPQYSNIKESQSKLVAV